MQCCLFDTCRNAAAFLHGAIIRLLPFLDQELSNLLESQAFLFIFCECCRCSLQRHLVQMSMCTVLFDFIWTRWPVSNRLMKCYESHLPLN